jgi:hypothetical protein
LRSFEEEIADIFRKTTQLACFGIQPRENGLKFVTVTDRYVRALYTKDSHFTTVAALNIIPKLSLKPGETIVYPSGHRDFERQDLFVGLLSSKVYELIVPGHSLMPQDCGTSGVELFSQLEILK